MPGECDASDSAAFVSVLASLLLWMWHEGKPVLYDPTAAIPRDSSFTIIPSLFKCRKVSRLERKSESISRQIRHQGTNVNMHNSGNTLVSVNTCSLIVCLCCVCSVICVTMYTCYIWWRAGWLVSSVDRKGWESHWSRSSCTWGLHSPVHGWSPRRQVFVFFFTFTIRVGFLEPETGLQGLFLGFLGVLFIRFSKY